jgi:hypothetical protein
VTANGKHPASVALQSLMVAIQEAPLSEDRLTEAARYIAAIVQNNDDLRAACTELARDKVALEELDTKRVLVIADLKSRLLRAAEENEALYQDTNHEVGIATERHLRVMRIRALLDLETPLPPRRPAAISTTSHNGAPHRAATH